MNTEKLEKLFTQLDEAVTLLQTDLGVSYVEALAETIQNVSYEGKAQQMDGLPTNETIEKLNQLYRKLKLTEEDRETVRKLIQLGFIKAIRVDKIQSNHQITPDSIAFLVAHFINVIKEDQQEALHIHDLATGSGNLLLVVMDYLAKKGHEVTAEAVDNDDLLISLAANSAHLQKWEDQIQFHHSDSLQELLIEPADLAVADLPVGYYPMEERAQKFQTSFKDTHSYAHFLLIEQHLKYLKEGGWGFFIVPRNLFETDEKGVLMSWLKENGFFQSMLHLPESLFQSTQAQKSILILQKAGNGAKQAKQVLLATIPDLKDARKMQDFIKEFHNWSRLML